MQLIRKCPGVEEIWPAIVGDQTAREIQQHIERCPLCRHRLKELAEEIGQVRSLFGALVTSDREDGRGDDAGDVLFSSENRGPDRGRPEVIGNYVIEEELARGGQARIFRAKHASLGTDVVVKLAHEPIQQDGDLASRLVQEGQILAAIQQEALVRVIDLGCYQQRPYLVLEWIQGMNLRHYCRTHRLTAPRILEIISDVARAVETAHRYGVLHLDLKPDNVLITSQGTPKLIDFGTAALLRACPVSGWSYTWRTGSPDYMAPEQYAGDDSRLSPSTDLYGLGGILHFLLYGVPPSVSPHDQESSLAETEPSEEESRMRQGLSTICRRALREAPEERYQSVSDFLQALKALPLSVSQRRFLRKSLAVCVALVGLWLTVYWSTVGYWHHAAESQGMGFSCFVEGSEVRGRIGQDVIPKPSASIRLFARSAPDEQLRFYVYDSALGALPLEARSSLGEQHRDYVYPVGQRSAVIRFRHSPTLLLAGAIQEGRLPSAEEVAADLSVWTSGLPDSVAAISFSSHERGVHFYPETAGPLISSEVIDQLNQIRDNLARRFHHFSLLLFRVEGMD